MELEPALDWQGFQCIAVLHAAQRYALLVHSRCCACDAVVYEIRRAPRSHISVIKDEARDQQRRGSWWAGCSVLPGQLPVPEHCVQWHSATTGRSFNQQHSCHWQRHRGNGSLQRDTCATSAGNDFVAGVRAHAWQKETRGSRDQGLQSTYLSIRRHIEIWDIENPGATVVRLDDNSSNVCGQRAGFSRRLQNTRTRS